MQLPTQLLRRNLNAHKGDFGHLFIIAGSTRFSGAAALCSEAAMCSGAGLVTIGIPRGLNNALIAVKPKEVMTLPLAQTRQGNLSLAAYKAIKNFLKHIDILVIGPGLGQEKSTQYLIRKLISETDKPLIIDADGLNALVGKMNFLLKRKEKAKSVIVTPHPAEMARLLKTSIKTVQKKRKKIAITLASDFGLTVVLKGRNTVVANSRGKTYINRTGNPGMATAGSGDVLSGMIAAFLGQGLDAFNAAKYAVYLHGLAGDLAAKEKTQLSLVASDIIHKIPEAIKQNLKSQSH
jgi:NAD(P)H-hydrate epimerase